MSSPAKAAILDRYSVFSPPSRRSATATTVAQKSPSSSSVLGSDTSLDQLTDKLFGDLYNATDGTITPERRHRSESPALVAFSGWAEPYVGDGFMDEDDDDEDREVDLAYVPASFLDVFLVTLPKDEAISNNIIYLSDDSAITDAAAIKELFPDFISDSGDARFTMIEEVDGSVAHDSDVSFWDEDSVDWDEGDNDDADEDEDAMPVSFDNDLEWGGFAGLEYQAMQMAADEILIEFVGDLVPQGSVEKNEEEQEK